MSRLCYLHSSRRHDGALDLEKLKKLVEWHIDRRIEGLVLFRTQVNRHPDPGRA